MTDWLIRPGTDDDLSGASALTMRWEAEGIAHGLRRDSVEQLRERCGPLFFVAESGGSLAGFANATIGESAPGERAIWADGARFIDLTDLYVLPEHRRAGIGSALLGTVLDAARGLGIEHALVYSAAHDWRRITAFYERFGFRMWFVELFKDPGA